MTRFGFVAALALTALLPLAARADEAAVTASSAAVKWQPAPAAAGLPKGTMVAVLFGDPSKAEPFATRTKFPAGTKIMPHTHPVDENITVLSGALHLGYGETFDVKKATTIRAGGFFHNPKGVAHYGWVTEPTIIQNNSVGPFGRTPVKTATNEPKK